MNKISTTLILASMVLLSACGQQQTVASLSNQNLRQANASQSTASPENAPANMQQSNAAQSDRSSYKPKNGYVPDEATAISIAVAVWVRIYGKEQIEGERPYKATLKNGVWTVTGTLPDGYVGGTAVAEVAQDDGCILKVMHYK